MPLNRPPSVRTIIALALLAMGALGLVLALFTGSVYRNLALENQRESLGNMIGVETRNLLEDLTETATDLGLALQREPEFRAAFAKRDLDQLQLHLNSQFHQYFVTAGVLGLERISAFDIDFKPIAGASGESGLLPDAKTGAVCDLLYQRARARRGPGRARVLSAICNFRGQAYHSVILPIGGVAPKGYLEVVSSPLSAMYPLQLELEMPLNITSADGTVLFRSDDWPEPELEHLMLIARHDVLDSSGKRVFTLRMANDVADLHADLSAARKTATVISGIIALGAAMLVLLLIQATTLRPLATLTRQLRKVRADPAHLRDKLTLRGTREVRDLTADFNSMRGELQSLYDRLESLAFEDKLTCLPNRNRFHAYLDMVADRERRSAGAFALLLMDLDRFKQVNDTMGHHVGDELLRQVGERFRGALRGSDIFERLDSSLLTDAPEDLIARIGGDEFAAILPGVSNPEDAAIVAQKLGDAMEEKFVLDGENFSVGVSIGIALYPTHADDKIGLMRRADVAMYHAKKARLGYAFYEAGLEQQAIDEHAMEDALLNALERNDLRLHFQPRVHAHSGAILGCEALVRWYDRNGDLIPPQQFLPVAERVGMAHKLANWVLEQALVECARWQHAGYTLNISVNLSTANLHDRNLLAQMRAAFGATPVPPERCTLEFSEVSLMQDPNHSQEVLRALTELGIRIAVDDFGSGSFSLGMMRRLPLSELKIAQELTRALPHDKRDAALLRSMIGLAHDLDMQVVAQGVEDRQLGEQLRAIGCDGLQGFGVAAPMDGDTLLQWLAQHAESCEEGWRLAAQVAPNQVE